MFNPATPEQQARLQQLRSELMHKRNAVIQSQKKSELKLVIQGMMEQNASADDIVSALENGGFFTSPVGSPEMAPEPEMEIPGEAPSAPPVSPEGEAPVAEENPSFGSREDEYMAAARRNMA